MHLWLAEGHFWKPKDLRTSNVYFQLAEDPIQRLAEAKGIRKAMRCRTPQRPQKTR